MKLSLVALMLLISSATLNAQSLPVNPSLLKGSWPSRWITCPNVPQRDYGVYHFRKSFDVATKPAKFIVHVTADNRYRLFVNGQPVCSGPARGDLYNWYFETVDIAPFLQSGKNTIAALVWNMGVDAPVAQISNQTGFAMQGDGEAEKVVNTNATWKVIRDSSYSPCSTDNGSRLRTYMVIGPGDQVDASKFAWGWQQTAYNDSKWPAAVQMANPVIVGYGTDNQWTLTPRNIPLMEETLQRIPSVRKTSGATINAGFLSGKAVTIPANSTVTVLLDQTFNTLAYPQLFVSKGKGASIKLTYAEALFDANRQKGNRDSIEGKTIIGNYDIFLPDGGSNRMFRPLWFRTWRYMQMEIQTKNEPLVINDFYGMYTGYPFKQVASFTSNDPSLQNIWNVGWRTARLCAGETYFDCPYYEQLQYEGDTRIQSLISLYVTGDDRLMRKALLDFYHSRVPEGLTQGRYPSNRLQVIPPFSLYWVSMLYDYMMHRKDVAFLEQFIQPARGILLWYKNNMDSTKAMLGPMKWWNFTDWNDAFPNGVPDGATNGNSSVVSLQYAYTLQQAAVLFNYFGKHDEAAEYQKLADQITASTYRNCFDAGKGVMANTPEKKTFSQHASIMAVLTGAVPASDMQGVLQKVLYDTSLSQATFYYRFYLTQALKKAGMANLYYSQLAPWRGMLANGLTTFAENPDPTRSDCHAWSSSPNYDFFATICGILPDAPAFSKVLIKPALGELKFVKATMPHPDGNIMVDLTRNGQAGIRGHVVLPPGVTGRFNWNGKEVSLGEGEQDIDL